MKTLIIAAAASGALASLNCTATAEVRTYCCPDIKSEVVKTGPSGALVMLGCAADNTNKYVPSLGETSCGMCVMLLTVYQRNWYWNYNGLYTAYSTQFKECYLNSMPFNDLKVLPNCKDDTYVLDLTRGKSGPLDKCNPNCVSQNKFPANTYFGDRQKETNMAADFPRPKPNPGWPWGRRERWV
ncbi:hypothetical protein CDEST_09342 [Colletotrichum destructivum]|uniref:Cyanovirin-N domain-containing protein n=1 Tax=Colletotrichum destructivum TaxID=34406 RepID=A0AAX4IMU0_9PEZI|nr:hypothetical protein CDEST_09342 [Colletotrichum destructivum]